MHVQQSHLIIITKSSKYMQQTCSRILTNKEAIEAPTLQDTVGATYLMPSIM